jgi:DNA-binding CsgD family transcriptional regulator
METDWKWDRLNPLERQVAELLVQGKSNAAICDEVFLSRARVQDCIKRILIKTGADSTRAAIALLVEERETLTLLRVLEQPRDGLVIIQDRVARFANSPAREMWGYDGNEMAGIPLIELIALRSRDLVMTQHELRVKGEPFSQTHWIGILCKGGQEKEVMVASAGQIQFRGKPAILVIVVPHVAEG